MNGYFQKCVFFFIFYLAAPQPTLGHFQENCLTHFMLISAFKICIWPEGYCEPRFAENLENALTGKKNRLNLSLQKMQRMQYLKQLQSNRIFSFWVKWQE